MSIPDTTEIIEKIQSKRESSLRASVYDEDNTKLFRKTTHSGSL